MMEEESNNKPIETKESEIDSKSINSASLSSNSPYDSEDDNDDDNDIMKQIEEI